MKHKREIEKAEIDTRLKPKIEIMFEVETKEAQGETKVDQRERRVEFEFVSLMGLKLHETRIYVVSLKRPNRSQDEL